MNNMDYTGYQATKTTPETCDIYTLSGANVAGDSIQKTFTGLPTNHYAVVVRFNAGLIGKWDGT